jgi:hypothetical protein
MMMMVTTSEVWFSVFQRTNSHADGNNQCGVVLSFSKNEPRGQTQDGNSQKIKELVLMWNCGSHKKKKIGQRTNPELWFFVDNRKDPMSKQKTTT